MLYGWIDGWMNGLIQDIGLVGGRSRLVSEQDRLEHIWKKEKRKGGRGGGGRRGGDGKFRENRIAE